MQNPRLAARYAKALMDIALEQNKLGPLFQDMQGIDNLCKSSSELVNMLRSPIVNADLKTKTMLALIETKVDGVTISFVKLIINKGREFYLPEIAVSFINLYKQYNKINEVTLTTAEPLDEAMRVTIENRVARQFQGMTIELTNKLDPSLIGGFVLESNHQLFDASIVRDLNDIKKQFLKNEYIPDIR